MDLILQNYIRYINKNTFEQGTKDFLEHRRRFIGGSENFKATHILSTKKRILENKLGLGYNLEGVPAIGWGNMHENTTRKISELLLNCTIREANGSIKHKNGVNAYSPDGIGVVRLSKKSCKYIKDKIHLRTKITRNLKSFISYLAIHPSEIIDKDGPEIICLFEFKTPYTRKIENVFKDNNYSRQILVGLDTIDICMLGIFVECDIKECLPDQLWFNKEYTHPGNSNSFYSSPPSIIGCSFLYPISDVAEIIDSCNNYIYQDIIDGVRVVPEKDFTLITGPIFIKEKLNEVSSKIILDEFGFIKSCKFLNEPEIAEIETLIKLVNIVDINQEVILSFYEQITEIISPFVIGFEYWKLMKYQFFLFPKIPGIVDLWEDECRELIDFIEQNKDLELDLIAENIKNFKSKFFNKKGETKKF